MLKQVFINVPVKDLDGHQWEVLYADMAKAPANPHTS